MTPFLKISSWSLGLFSECGVGWFTCMPRRLQCQQPIYKPLNRRKPQRTLAQDSFHQLPEGLPVAIETQRGQLQVKHPFEQRR